MGPALPPKMSWSIGAAVLKAMTWQVRQPQPSRLLAFALIGPLPPPPPVQTFPPLQVQLSEAPSAEWLPTV